MQESNYKIYLYPRWFITNATASLVALLACILALLHTSGTYVMFCLLFLVPVFAGIAIMNIIPLFSLRKPCIICTAAGIVLRLQLQPAQQDDNSYLRTIQAFIPWKNIHGIYLLQKKRWYARHTGVLRINYSINPHASQASRHFEIFVNQLNAHPESMYNTLMGLYSKYRPVNH